MLAHRLGLLPLTADPRQFSWPPPDWSPDTGTEKDTLEFSLAVRDDIALQMFCVEVKCNKTKERDLSSKLTMMTGEMHA